VNTLLQQLAEELVKAREEVRMTPEQVAVKIKMDQKFLLKMESGDFSFLPEIYLKAFLKEYAKCVGLSDQVVLQKYKRAIERKPLEESLPHEEREKEPAQPAAPRLITDEHLQTPTAPEKKFPFTQKQLLIAGSALVLVIVAALYIFVFRSGADAIVAERPYEESIQEVKGRYEDPSAKEDSTVAGVVSDSLLLTITSNDSSWIRINFDDATVREYFMYPKTTIDVKTGTKFLMTIGNPGALTFLLNTKPLQFTPVSSRKVVIEVTKDGIKNIEPLHP